VTGALEEQYPEGITPLGPVSEDLVTSMAERYLQARGVDIGGQAGLFFLIDVAAHLAIDNAGQHPAGGPEHPVREEVFSRFSHPVPPALPVLGMSGHLDESFFLAGEDYPWVVAADLSVACSELRTLCTLRSSGAPFDEVFAARVVDLVVQEVETALTYGH
jgi:hypothetical protein